MDNSVFRKRLRELRMNKHKYVNVYTVSELCGMNQDMYRRYENGEALPGFNHLIKIADYYNCSIDYLVGRSNDSKRY